VQYAREQDKERSVGARQARAFARAVEDDELLAQQQVFGDQLWFGAGQISDSAEDRGSGDGLAQARHRCADGTEDALRLR